MNKPLFFFAGDFGEGFNSYAFDGMRWLSVNGTKQAITEVRWQVSKQNVLNALCKVSGLVQIEAKQENGEFIGWAFIDGDKLRETSLPARADALFSEAQLDAINLAGFVRVYVELD